MKLELLRKLERDRAEMRAVVLVTHLKSGQQYLVYPLEKEAESSVEDSVLEAAKGAVRSDKGGTIPAPDGDGEGFLNVYNPPLRMIIVGAVHIAQPLSKIAAIAGYDVIVVDPRRSFATETRFPGVRLVGEWPDDGLKALDIDHRTAIVTLTHDPKLDDPGLIVALASDAFYIGSLGSKRTHAARLDRLRAEGLGDDALARIEAPIGLDIGAKSTAEIAVAIMGSITAALRQVSCSSARFPFPRRKVRFWRTASPSTASATRRGTSSKKSTFRPSPTRALPM